MDQVESVTPDLKGLTVDEEPYKQILEVFDHPETYEPKKGDLNVLSRSIRAKDAALDLIQRLKNNPTTFIEGLRVLQDNRGLFLCTVISETGTERARDTAKTVLRCLISLVKVSSSAQWYLSAYYLVVERFEVTVPDHLDVLLSFIGPENGSEQLNLTPIILLITIKSLKLAPKPTTDTVTVFVEFILDEDPVRVQRATFLNLVRVLESLYPLMPVPISTMYMSEKCKQMLLHHVSSLSASVLEDEQNYRTVCEVLRLVSTSCIDEELRNFNVKNYIQFLISGTKLSQKPFEELHLLSTLCIVKLWNSFPKNSDIKKEVTIQHLLSNITTALRENSKYREHIVETLAYISLDRSFKESLRSDADSISILIDILKKAEPHSTLVYGILTTIANLAKVKTDTANNRKKTASFLKSYSDPTSSKEEDDQEKVLTFSKALLEDYKIVEVFSKLKVMAGSVQESSSSINQVLCIIFSISCNNEKKIRQELVQQGALTIVLNYLITFSKVGPTTLPSNPDTILIETRISALRTLAKILVSVNPALAFKKYDISTSVPFLIELLGPNISEYNGIKASRELDYLEDMTQKDKYEALIALTNVLSVEDANIKKLIGSKTFIGYLDNFIIDSDAPNVQRATWELLSNLVSEPTILVYFFNVEKPANLQRLDLMVKMLNSSDEKLQTAVAGLMANAASEFQMVSQIILQTPDIWRQLRANIIGILRDQEECLDLVHRVLFILLGVSYAAEELGTEELNKIKSDKELKQAVAVAMRSTSKDIREVVLDVVKVVRFK